MTKRIRKIRDIKSRKTGGDFKTKHKDKWKLLMLYYL